jgi:signal transduction histidine kinase
MQRLLGRLTWRDWAVPAILWVAGQLELWPTDLQAVPVHGPKWPLAAALTVSALALCVRRTQPVTALVVVVASLLVTTTPQLHAFLLSALYLLVIAVFACGRYGSTPAKYVAVVLPEVPLLLWVAVVPDVHLANAWAWGLNALWIFALGAAFRRERMLRERVTQAVAAQSKMQAAEQRVTLAREVHDVVSHSLSVVVVQAELARLFITSDPVRAEAALQRVQDTGREALGETRRLLEALRDPSLANQAAQPPTWTDVPELVRRMRESGLLITLEAQTVDPELTIEASATAYRVVQEALTNALRHARTSRTTVLVTQQADLFVIDVQNDDSERRGADNSASASGYGLSGMQERVSACGGMLTTGPRPGGGYRVRAVLPLTDHS